MTGLMQCSKQMVVFNHAPVAKQAVIPIRASSLSSKIFGYPSGGSFVLDCANDRREYGTAGASGDRL
jgi:hypothetical protein